MWCPNLSYSGISIHSELGCIPKVGNLHISMFIYQNVVGFDVTMHDVSPMQRIEAGQSLIENVGTNILWYFALSLCDDWFKTTCIHVFQKEPKAWLIVEGIVAFNQALIIFALYHHCELISDQGTFFVVFRLHIFKGELRTVIEPFCEADFCKATLSKLMLNKDIIVLWGVFSPKLYRGYAFSLYLELILIFSLFLELLLFFSILRVISSSPIKWGVVALIEDACKKLLEFVRHGVPSNHPTNLRVKAQI